MALESFTAVMIDGHFFRMRTFPSRLGLYKVLFFFEAFVHESIIRLLPPPTCTARTIAILLRVYAQ